VYEGAAAFPAKLVALGGADLTRPRARLCGRALREGGGGLGPLAVRLQKEDLSCDIRICSHLRWESNHAAAGQFLDGLLKRSSIVSST
jgi:hypothetical protein